MTASSSRDDLHHGWGFHRKAAVLVAVCCFAFLAYSLNCLRSKSGGPQVVSTPNGAALQTRLRHAGAVKADPGTQETLQGDVKTQDTPQTQFAQLPKPVSHSLRRQQVSIFSSSSIYEGADEYESDFTEETVPLKPQGAWQKRLPKAVIIGVKKGGTRALLEFLRLNPQIAVSGKEIHYFDRYYDRGTEWYRKAMPYSYENQITLEKTPGYFITPEVPQRIYRMSPDMKFLVVMRNPIARAISDHAQSVVKGKTTPFKEKAMLSLEKCEVDDGWSAIRIGLYAKHLSNWLKYFSISQFFFVNGENLVASPGNELEKVQDFLHIRRTVTAQSFIFNVTKGFPCLRSNKNGHVKCLGESKGRAHQPVDHRVRQCLAEFYRPYNEQFYKMTGVDFHWEDKGI